MKKLEVIASSLESLEEAIAGGADRIELCVNLFCGGTTPSAALVLEAVKRSPIPINLLIRPRTGDFCYSRSEIELICKEIEFAKENGISGIVCGFLLPDGNVDKELTELIVQLAKPMTFTFHRAFDICKNPEKALEDIIDVGCSHLLTSGQANTAIEGFDLLKKIVQLANDRIIVMPGSGVNEQNILKLTETGAKEFHMSASVNKNSTFKYINNKVALSDNPLRDNKIQTASREKVAEVKRILGGVEN